jgi:hypothetical protein
MSDEYTQALVRAVNAKAVALDAEADAYAVCPRYSLEQRADKEREYRELADDMRKLAKELFGEEHA